MPAGSVNAGLPPALGSLRRGMTLADDFVELSREGIVFDEARVRVTQRFGHFSSPGRRFIGKTKSSEDRFVVTRSRIYASGRFFKTIDLPCDAGNIHLFAFDLQGDKITIGIPEVSGVMGPGFSGELSVTVHTDKAPQLLAYFESLKGGSPRG